MKQGDGSSHRYLDKFFSGGVGNFGVGGVSLYFLKFNSDAECIDRQYHLHGIEPPE